MPLKYLKKSELNQWVVTLLKENGRKFYGPKEKNGFFDFDEIGDASELRLDYDTTVIPPKKYFQPPQELMLKFKTGGADYENVIDKTPFVLFGVHPYDIIAINQMDKIFSMENRDEHYLARREASVLVGVDVETVSANHFAGSMGTSIAKTGWDVLLTKINGGYLVQSGNPKGEKLMASIAGGEKGTNEQLAEREKIWLDNCAAMRKHELKCAPEDLHAFLEKGYNHPIWEEKARLCFSCGSCNLVCPTCYCFDVQDDVAWDTKCGTRCRSWDGCLLKDFETVTGGHNFRKRKADRYRHRFYRKGKYVPEKMGEIACVGCGRCIKACVSNIANPVEVYNRLVEA
jgi:ferredoxin